MRENKALAAWRAGGQTIGAWLSVGNAYTAETMTGLGFDWLCVEGNCSAGSSPVERAI